MIHRKYFSFTSVGSFPPFFETLRNVYMGVLLEKYVNCRRLPSFFVREASVETAVGFKYLLKEKCHRPYYLKSLHEFSIENIYIPSMTQKQCTSNCYHCINDSVDRCVDYEHPSTSSFPIKAYVYLWVTYSSIY